MALTCKRLRATSQKETDSVVDGGGQEGERELIKQEITKNGRSVPASNLLPMHLQEQGTKMDTGHWIHAAFKIKGYYIVANFYFVCCSSMAI